MCHESSCPGLGEGRAVGTSVSWTLRVWRLYELG